MATQRKACFIIRMKLPIAHGAAASTEASRLRVGEVAEPQTQHAAAVPLCQRCPRFESPRVIFFF